MTTNEFTSDNEDSGVEALISRCLQGDQFAYTQLYDRFAAGIYRLCYSLVLNRQDAEDVVQEVFVYAFKNLHQYNPARAAFKTWLYTISVSRCRNTYRRKRLPQVGLSQIFQLNIAAPCSEAPEAALAQRAAQDVLAIALADLSPQLREAVVLRYGHGLIYREIADVMGCPPKTAESRVRLAHKRLRHILQSQGRELLEELLSF
jgi:RNA polymerase sigma-70 factor, ECF subfamily